MKVSKGADFGDDRERYGMTYPESVPLRVPKALDTITDVVLAYNPPAMEAKVAGEIGKGGRE